MKFYDGDLSDYIEQYKQFKAQTKTNKRKNKHTLQNS